MAYVAPTWVNGQAPALDAEALNAISQALAKLPMENGGTFATSGAAGLYNLINAAATLTSSTLSSGDYVGVQDVSAGTGKRTTLSNLASWIGSNGTGAKIATGSYTGTGTYGSRNPNSITFPFVPKFFILQEYTNWSNFGFFFGEAILYWQTGITDPATSSTSNHNSNAISKMTSFTQSGQKLTWYHSANADGQMNVAPSASNPNIKYYWIAFG